MQENFSLYFQKLNSPEILPAGWLARNHVCYPLVCSINIITGLYLSQNYAAVPLFLKRAFEYVQAHSEKLDENEAYRRLVLAYLKEMAKYVSKLELDEMDSSLIPPELL